MIERYVREFAAPGRKVSIVTIRKIDQLWVGEDPAILAYWGLQGFKAIKGILNIDEVELGTEGGNIKTYGCSYTKMRLINLRADHPELTKEQFLEMLQNEH